MAPNLEEVMRKMADAFVTLVDQEVEKRVHEEMAKRLGTEAKQRDGVIFDTLTTLENRFTDAFSEARERLIKATKKNGVAKTNGHNGHNGHQKASPRKGTKLDMSCRVEGCKNPSGGPRWGFMCGEHREKLSVKEQKAARDAWNAKHGRAEARA